MKTTNKESYLPQQIRDYAGLLRSKIWTIGLVTLALTLIFKISRTIKSWPTLKLRGTVLFR